MGAQPQGHALHGRTAGGREEREDRVARSRFYYVAPCFAGEEEDGQLPEALRAGGEGAEGQEALLRGDSSRRQALRQVSECGRGTESGKLNVCLPHPPFPLLHTIKTLGVTRRKNF